MRFREPSIPEKKSQANEVADKLYALHRSIETLKDSELVSQLQASFDRIKMDWIHIIGKRFSNGMPL